MNLGGSVRGSAPVAVGIDLVAIADVTTSLADHGMRYAARVYTDREIRECRRGADLVAARLAARFAAKEATLKALRHRAAFSWRDLELVGGRMVLAGPVADTARRARIAWVDVAVGQAGGYASAVAIARPADRPRRRLNPASRSRSAAG